MKIILSLLLFFSYQTFARECHVDGISDSPQELSCRFKNSVIKLTCLQETYFVNSSLVTDAYHLDVEEGPSPLVFKGTDFEFVVFMVRKSFITAEFIQKGKTSKGICRPGQK